MQVREVMSESAITCTLATPLTEVARAMAEHDCGALPVLEEGTKQIKGMITDRDITVRAVAAGKNASALTARDVMTPQTVTITADASLSEAAELMRAKRVRRLVVTERDYCVGIIAVGDIARAAPPEVSGDLLEEISKPTEEAARL